MARCNGITLLPLPPPPPPSLLPLSPQLQVVQVFAPLSVHHISIRPWHGIWHTMDQVHLFSRTTGRRKGFICQKQLTGNFVFATVVVVYWSFFFIYFSQFAELQGRIQAIEIGCYCKILRISYKDHVTNEEVRVKIQQAIEPHEDLLTIVKRRKLQWNSHVSHSSSLAKIIFQGTVKRGRRQGRQRKR